MNRNLSLVLAASILASITTGCATQGLPASSTAGARTNAALVSGKAVEGVAVVRARPGQTLRLKQSFGGETKQEIPSLGVYSVKLPAGKSLNDLTKELGSSAMYVEKDYTVTMADPVNTLTA